MWPAFPTTSSIADLIADCALGHKLGYDAAWLLEHHFSDYYPTPSPLLMMAHIAAKFPDLSLGTSVLVLPWYHPLRLAEEIAMLNSLTQGTLHLGIGRGTAKMEYDAYNIEMNEGRARFSEVFTIVEQGLAGKAVQPSRTVLEYRAADPHSSRPRQQTRAFLRGDRKPGECRGDGRPRHSPDLPVDFSGRTTGKDPRALA